MNLRPYQQEAIEFLTARRRAFLVAPAGSGKTVMGAHAVAKAMPRGFAWIGNTKEQVQQAEAALLAAGRTGGLVCCMMARPDLSNCDLVVIDESHHAPAAVWGSVIGSVRPDAVLWGLSATPFGDDEARNDFLKAKFEDFMFIDRDEVMAGGHLVSGRVIPIDIDRPFAYDAELKPAIEAECKRWKARYRFVPEYEIRKRVQWQMTQEHLQNNMARNAAIVNIAKSEIEAGEVVIILVASIEHGEKLVEQIGEQSAIITSKLPAKLRRQRVEDLRAGRLRCAVATSLLDEGADVPIASTLILAAGGRSPTKTIQRTGRVMRPHKDKMEGVVYDFVDHGLAFAHAQWKSRRRVYLQLGYTIDSDSQKVF